MKALEVMVRDGGFVGIVSRSKLIQALASVGFAEDDLLELDRSIRHEFLSRMEWQSWTGFGSRNVIVSGGELDLWGLVGSAAERKALIALAEGVPGATVVVDEMIAGY